MKIIYYGQDELPEFNNPVVTVGAFDGLHTAHMQIVSQLIETAKNVQGQSILITFNPHPRTILDARESNIKLLTTLEERIQILSESQLDYFIVVPFDYAFSTMLPKEYVERFLIGQFKPHTIIAGYDHRFGMHGQGDIALLRQYADDGFFNFVEIDVKKIAKSAISSTRIRQSIAQHQIRDANILLGYPYPLTGKVVTGDKLGRKIGFPTANLEIENKDKLIPPNGIYAAICEIQGICYDGLLYIGTSSTTLMRKEPVVEVHILDFNAEIYGHEISIRVLDFIREDRNFDDLDALRNQIILDKQKILQSIQKYKIYSHPLSAPRTAIVLLNYNGEAYLRKYLGSLVRYCPGNSRIYVIDNHSTDGSCLYLDHHFPEVQIIRLQRNYGFAGGYNRGLAQIDADYYVLVNSDVEVDHDWISPLVQMMLKDPEVLAIQPKIRSLMEPGKFEYAGAAGGYLDILGYPFCKGRIIDEVEEDQLQYDQTSEIFWSSGAAMLVKSAAFKAIGGFDQDYFAHQEEIDLCWRLKRIGGKILFCPESVVYHLGGGTLDYDHPRKTYLNFRNNLFTIFKNYPVMQLLYVIPIRLVLDVGIAFSYALKGKFLTGYKIFQAYVVAIINTVYLIHKRSHYNQLIKALQFRDQNRRGQLRASIFLQFYFSGNRRFSQIPDQYFKRP